MKTILVAISFLLVSASVFAQPQLGDSISFQQTFTVKTADGVQSQSALILQTIVGQNVKTGEFEVKTELLSPSGRLQEKINKIAPTDMLTDQKIDDILAGCVKDGGGALEEIDVAGEKIKTCRLPLTSGDFVGFQWIGHVPFGVAQSALKMEDSILVTIVRKYSFGPARK